MREGWEEVALGDLVRRRTDFTPVRPDDDYTILGVQRSGWGFVQRGPIKGRDQRFTKLMQIHQDDLVYRMITAFEAPSAVAGSAESGSFVTPQTFPVFAINSKRVLPSYMRLVTTWPSFHDEMASRCTGTVLRRKTLSIGAFQSISIPLPALPEQRRIVDLIGALNQVIGHAGAGLNSARELDTRLRALATLGDHVITVGEALSPVSHPVQLDSDMEYQEIGVRSHGRGTFLKEPTTMAVIGSKKVFWMVPGALVFNIVFAWEGAVALLGPEVDGRIGSHRFPNYISVIPDGEAFMSHYFRTEAGRQLLADCSPGGAGRNRTLNRGRLMSSKIRVPIPETWQGVVAELATTTQTVTASQAHLDRLHALRSNLLTALLSGEHEIPESYDELMGEDA